MIEKQPEVRRPGRPKKDEDAGVLEEQRRSQKLIAERVAEILSKAQLQELVNYSQELEKARKEFEGYTPGTLNHFVQSCTVATCDFLSKHINVWSVAVYKINKTQSYTVLPTNSIEKFQKELKSEFKDSNVGLLISNLSQAEAVSIAREFAKSGDSRCEFYDGVLSFRVFK